MAVDYGYGDGAPDAKYEERYDERYGYGHRAAAAAADEEDDDVAKYGYGDAAPDDHEDVAKYGYGDAAPDGDDAANRHGYEDVERYGYGDDSADRGGTRYVGYNDEDEDDPRKRNAIRRHKSDSAMKAVHRRGGGTRYSPDRSERSVATAESYGSYGDAEDPLPNPNDGASGGQPPRRQRYRRRNSVTRYSIQCSEEAAMVAKEHAEHESIIEMYRNGGGGGPSVAPATIPQHDRRSRLDGTSSKQRRAGKGGDEKDDPTAAAAAAKNRKGAGASPAKTKMGRAVRKVGRRFSLGGGAYKG